MNTLLKRVTIAALGCLIVQFSSCTSSRLVDIWRDASVQTPVLNKMLVIAVRKSPTKRRLWEDAFVLELTKSGVSATSSYTLFPDAPPDTDQVIAASQEGGFDGVLVILRLPTQTSREYVRGYTTSEQVVQYSPYWPRYRTFFREIEHLGYVDSQTVAINTIDISTTREGGRMIWSATSKTPDPNTVEDAQSGIAELVMEKLQTTGIVAPKK